MDVEIREEIEWAKNNGRKVYDPKEGRFVDPRDLEERLDNMKLKEELDEFSSSIQHVQEQLEQCCEMLDRMAQWADVLAEEVQDA